MILLHFILVWPSLRMEEPKNNPCILMQKDSGLKSKLHHNLKKFEKIRLLQRKLMKLVTKPHHLHTIERERCPTWTGSKCSKCVIRCGKRECHKGLMRKHHTWDKKKWNILIISCYYHKTPNLLLFTFLLEIPILLAP